MSDDETPAGGEEAAAGANDDAAVEAGDVETLRAEVASLKDQMLRVAEA